MDPEPCPGLWSRSFSSSEAGKASLVLGVAPCTFSLIHTYVHIHLEAAIA